MLVDVSIPGGDYFEMVIQVTVEPDCNFSVIAGGEPNDVVKYDISSKLEVII